MLDHTKSTKACYFFQLLAKLYDTLLHTVFSFMVHFLIDDIVFQKKLLSLRCLLLKPSTACRHLYCLYIRLVVIASDTISVTFLSYSNFLTFGVLQLLGSIAWHLALEEFASRNHLKLVIKS